jgi:trehalose 6-phosphate synthase
VRGRSLAPSPLVVVSNRLPHELHRGEGAGSRRNVGGLVNALEPALDGPESTWIGWDGIALPNLAAVEAALAAPRSGALPSGATLVGVPLSERDVKGFYNGLCNRALWPILHDFAGTGVFEPEDWERYVRVNRRFAGVVASRAPRGARVWVHDFQLALLPLLLRERGLASRIDFFLHTPFPAAEIFRTLPWRRELIDGLLAADAIVVHTERYRDNFVAAATEIADVTATPPNESGEVELARGSARSTVAARPIGIDVDGFTELAATSPVRLRARRIQAAYGGRAIVFGADRLDYTKGILERLAAVERLLRLHPERRGTFALVQVVVPSRHAVEEYRRMKRDIDREVGRINGEWGADGWQPIHYVYRALDRRELVAHYLAASVALVTPLRDGMNLVAAEFVASRVDGGGVLVLSEFAGIADILDGAIVVNPHDVDALAAALDRALRMPPEERVRRMSRLRPTVLGNPARSWAARCLAVGARLAAGRTPAASGP